MKRKGRVNCTYVNTYEKLHQCSGDECSSSISILFPLIQAFFLRQGPTVQFRLALSFLVTQAGLGLASASQVLALRACATTGSYKHFLMWWSPQFCLQFLSFNVQLTDPFKYHRLSPSSKTDGVTWCRQSLTSGLLGATASWADGQGHHLCFVVLCSGVLVPGGFGVRGTEGKIQAISWARKQRKPLLGKELCYVISSLWLGKDMEICQGGMGL